MVGKPHNPVTLAVDIPGVHAQRVRLPDAMPRTPQTQAADLQPVAGPQPVAGRQPVALLSMGKADAIANRVTLLRASGHVLGGQNTVGHPVLR
jgi:hypothetical protein